MNYSDGLIAWIIEERRKQLKSGKKESDLLIKLNKNQQDELRTLRVKNDLPDKIFDVKIEYL